MIHFANFGPIDHPDWRMVTIIGAIPNMPMFILVQDGSGGFLVVHRGQLK